jgi:hypothetical protein
VCASRYGKARGRDAIMHDHQQQNNDKANSSNVNSPILCKLADLNFAERDVEFAPISGSNWENRHFVYKPALI